MIFLFLLFLGVALCGGQKSMPLFRTRLPFSKAARAGTPFSGSISSVFAPNHLSTSGSSSTSGPLSASGTYASCLLSQPSTAVRSNSLFSYSLLESTFTNPALKDFYRTSTDSENFYQVIYDEVKAIHTHDAKLIAGSLSLLLEHVIPQVSPLVNAVSMTNAIGDLLSLGAVVTTEEFDDFVDAFINAVSKALRYGEDGSPKVVASGLLNFLSDRGSASFSTLHQFTSILAGHYRIALHSTCTPAHFEEIPAPP